jgi:hypothetical protein
VYFDSIIKRKIKEGNLKVELEITNKFSRFAGKCVKKRSPSSNKSCSFTIQMASGLFTDPFLKQNLKSQIVNGVKYYNPLSTFISTLQHEMIHLIIFDFCPNLDVRGGHSDTFKLISRRLFGHTEFRHLLGIDVEKFGVTKEEITGKSHIRIFIDENGKPSAKAEKERGGKEIKVKVVKFNPKKVRINLDGKIWNIPYSYVIRE